MNTTNADQICPLCGEDEHMGKKAKLLYGHLVCKKCYDAFYYRRGFAFAVDFILWNVCLVIVSVLVALSSDALQGLALLALLLVVPTLYLKDGFSGFSPGKAMMGIQVVDEMSGQPIGFGASFKRNLPLIITFMPLIFAAQLYQGGYRIGDTWANTRVIWKKYRDKTPFTIGNAS